MPLDRNILKKKIAGIPVPVIAIGAGVVGVIAFRKFGGGGGDQDTSSASPADFSAGTSGGSAADFSGGVGDQGSSFDQGFGAGGGSSFFSDTGGAFVPATAAEGPQQVTNKIVKIIRRPRHRAGQRRRPLIVNKIQVTNITKRRRPNKVQHDRQPKVPINMRPGNRGRQIRATRTGRTPPIIRIGKKPRSGGR